jgi:hypothetical protein
MAETTCRYAGDRDQAIVSYLYDDESYFDRGRAEFEAHVAVCDACRTELNEFTDVRVALGGWSPPRFRRAGSLAVGVDDPPQSAPARRSSWRDIPVWAQAAAALLCLGVGAGIANLDVQYGPTGLHVRTGWSATPDPAAQPNQAADVSATGADTVAAPWRPELAALEERLRDGIRQAVAAAAPQATADELRRVRTLVEDSERRQERELALRLAEAIREVTAQRQADLARIDRNMGAIQSNTGREMLRQRSEMLNYVTVRTASQRGQ